MSGYKPIKDQIVATLQTISGLTVYGKEEKAIKSFPAACVSAKEDQEAYESVGVGGSNKVIYQHYVRIYFRTDEQDDPDYEDVLEETVDSIKEALRANVNLNDSCDFSIPTAGIWRFGAKETPVRYYELVVASSSYVKRT